MKKSTVIFAMLFLFFGITVSAQPEKPNENPETKEFSDPVIKPGINDPLWGGSGSLEYAVSSTKTETKDKDLFAGGTGTEQDPWQIETAEHLNNIRLFLGTENADKYYKQTADINLGVAPWNEGEGWEPIGNSTYRFMGTYDGDGFAIHQLTIDRPNTDYTGLFGYSYDAHFQNIAITNASITSSFRIGILAGRSDYSILSNCYSTGTVVASGNWAGGLVGVNIGSEIYGCFSAADIDAEGFSIGGLCGTLEFGGLIENSYATGDVSGLRNIGGLVGWLSGSSQIINSYSTGYVTGITQAGGLAGRGDDTNTITNSYWNIETSGQTTSWGGEGKTTVEMISESTFTSWDFAATWEIIEGETYPYLQWQGAPGDFNYPGTTLSPLSFSAEPADGLISLSWLPPSTVAQTGFKLYRNGNLIQTLDAETLEYVDSGVENYVIYTYALTALYEGGQESNPVTLNAFPTPGFSQGEGTEENPFLVSNAGELFTVRLDLSAYYLQTADIDLGVDPWNLDEGWMPLSHLGGPPFSGSYNGSGYTISGIIINRPGDNHQSLFGFATGGTITNLNISNSHISANDRAAILAGWVNNTHISNINITSSTVTANSLAGGLVYVANDNSSLANIKCNVVVNVNTGNYWAGGIVGSMQYESTLDKSISSGYVHAGWYAGGLVGTLAANSTISQSYSTSNVVAESVVGGLTGNLSASIIIDSYATGNVNGNWAGGLIGRVALNETAMTSVVNNYSIGEVNGEENTGGLVGIISGQGENPLYDFQNNYWNNETSGQESSAMGESLSTSEMLIQTNFNNWDFADTWSNIENITYPYLQWQGEPGVHNYPLIEHEVTFHLNMENAEDFNPDNDVVYITGSMFEWSVPGSDQENQTMTRMETSMKWEKTLTLPTGEYYYKYFLNAGWDGGEWTDAPDRQITILGDTIIENTWGVMGNGTNIDNIDLAFASMYPNPADEILIIRTDSETSHIRIIDATGRIIFSQDFNQKETQINVDTFAPGLYVVHIFAKEGLISRKLLVK